MDKATLELIQQIVLVLTLLMTAIAAIAQCWNAWETRRLVNISQFGAPMVKVLPPKVFTDKWEEFTFSFEVQNVGGGILAIERVELVWWQKMSETRHPITLDAVYPVMVSGSQNHTFKVNKLDLTPNLPAEFKMILPPSQSIEGMLTCTCVGLDPVEFHCHFTT